jgi:hypothetical protein
MVWLKLIHVGIGFLPSIVAIVARNNIPVMLASIACVLLIITQWIVLGHCILSPLENNGSKFPASFEFMAKKWGLHPRDFGKGAIIMLFIAPCFYQLSQIARILRL